VTPTDRRRSAPVSDRLLARRVLQIASGLHAAGLRTGDRVLIAQAPGPTRTSVAAACRRLGAEVVLVDPRRAGRRALRSARPDALVGGAPVLLRAWRLPGVRLRLATSRLPVIDRALGVRLHLADVVTRHLLLALPPEPAAAPAEDRRDPVLSPR
jgi:hypothetical protein